MPTSDEKLASLLQDLEKMAEYLHGRGDKDTGSLQTI